MEYKRAAIILLACLCVKIHGDVPNPKTLVENMPGYAVTTAIELLNSTQCRKEMEEFRDAVDRGAFWSLRMLDASGQPSSGFISGNNFWLGDRDQCELLSQKRMFAVKEEKVKNMQLYRFLDDDFPPFRLNFFGAQMHHNSSMQYHMMMYLEEVLVLGICLPASCTEHEVATMLRKVFDERLLLVTRLYSMDVEFLKISDLNDDYTWLLDGKMMLIILTETCYGNLAQYLFDTIPRITNIARDIQQVVNKMLIRWIVFFACSLILLALVCVAITGTVYDACMQRKRLQAETKSLVEKNNTVERNGDVDKRGDQVQKYIRSSSEVRPVSRTKQILLCFSAYSNAKYIFDLNTSSGDILSFHGLRFFAMIWAITFHVILFQMNVIVNRTDGYLRSGDIFMHIINNAFLTVDTFFTLSGFLLVHGHLKKQTKVKQALTFYNAASNLIDKVVKRYIRIMPAYFVTMLLVMVIFTWCEQFSLVYFSETAHNVCWKYWWRNMLFIHNFYDLDDMCMKWSWYLSNDMQFYIFGTIVLILSTSYYYTAITLSVLTVIASTAVHAYVAYSMEYKPTFDMFHEAASQLYIKPHMRIPPFIVGMGTALLLSKWNYKLEMSKKALATCWSVAMLLLLTALLGPMNRNMPLSMAILYESCSRLIWSLGIAWIMIACITGNGGIVNTILSFPCWILLSRLTYCAYLLNPVVIIVLAMLMKQPLYFDTPNLITVTTGVSTIVYAMSIPLSMFVVLPISSYFQKCSVFSKKMN